MQQDIFVCCQNRKTWLTVTADQYGNLFSAFSAGLTAGALLWGVLVDIIGR